MLDGHQADCLRLIFDRSSFTFIEIDKGEYPSFKIGYLERKLKVLALLKN
jgi:hypothetical protein